MVRLKIPIILPLLIALTGCAPVTHAQQLLVLHAQSHNKEDQKTFVKNQNTGFVELVKVIEDGTIKQYSDKKKIVKSFGEPIVARPVLAANKTLEQWLYRYSTEYFSSKKVYLYFDGQGMLQQWELVPAGELSKVESSVQP